MNVFVIGGEFPTMVGAVGPDGLSRLASVGRSIGASLARSRHMLITCSPFQGSADLEVQIGFAAEWRGDAPANSAEMHYPDHDEIGVMVLKSIERLQLRGAVQKFRHPAIVGSDGKLDFTNSWLLSQLAALDRSHVVVSLGGNTTGSANLLLHLAEARRVPMLPLPYFGGAAEAAFRRRRYELLDRLGADFGSLEDADRVDQATALLGSLVGGATAKRAKPGKDRFFISYPRARPSEADFVEMTLRRRNQDVFRDDHGLESGSHLPSAIRDQLHAATVFVALWGQEYACSPWCHDELELALDRSLSTGLKIVLLCVDSTRMIPSRARELIRYRCTTRSEIEALVLSLVED